MYIDDSTRMKHMLDTSRLLSEWDTVRSDIPLLIKQLEAIM